MGADYSFELKNIEMWVPAFFKQNISSVATVSTVNVFSGAVFKVSKSPRSTENLTYFQTLQVQGTLNCSYSQNRHSKDALFLKKYLFINF